MSEVSTSSFIFRDVFDRTEIGPDWIVDMGNWIIKDSVLLSTGIGTKQIRSNKTWSKFLRLSVTVIPNNYLDIPTYSPRVFVGTGSNRIMVRINKDSVDVLRSGESLVEKPIVAKGQQFIILFKLLPSGGVINIKGVLRKFFRTPFPVGPVVLQCKNGNHGFTSLTAIGI